MFIVDHETFQERCKICTWREFRVRVHDLWFADRVQRSQGALGAESGQSEPGGEGGQERVHIA